MSRLTYKDGQNYYSLALKNFPFSEPSMEGSYAKASALDDAWREERNKLGQLEDIIEDELGVDLPILIEALKNGFYYIDLEGRVCYSGNPCSLLLDEGQPRPFSKQFIIVIVKLKDYGKKEFEGWALTKEELL